MSSPRVLKFKHTFPWLLERRLRNEFRYNEMQRIWGGSDGDYMIFRRTGGEQTNLPAENRKPPDKPTFEFSMSNAEKYALEKRLDAMVGNFQDPYKKVVEVRRRLHNYGQALATVERRQFVIDYIEENFPEELLEHTGDK
jgi:hypothetical protein